MHTSESRKNISNISIGKDSFQKGSVGGGGGGGGENDSLSGPGPGQHGQSVKKQSLLPFLRHNNSSSNQPATTVAGKSFVDAIFESSIPSSSSTPASSHSLHPQNPSSGRGAGVDQKLKFEAILEIILPAFTGLGFSGAVEDLNRLVREWALLTSSDVVVADLNNLLKTGMVSLATKLNLVADENLASRCCEVWSNFYCNIIPNVQSAFVPLRQDHNLMLYGKKIDIRRMCLISFRSYVIWPMKLRLQDALGMELSGSGVSQVTDIVGKLTQMLATLASLSDSKQDQQQAMRNLLQIVKKKEKILRVKE